VKINERNQDGFFKNYLSKKSTVSIILAQKLTKLMPILKLRWILAVSSLPLFGIYAAFGIAPDTVTQPISQVMVVDEILLPLSTESAESNPAVFWFKEYVRRDDSIGTILSRLNVRNPDAIQFVQQHILSSETSKLLKPGHAFEASVDSNGNLITLDYLYDHNEFLRISATSESNFLAEKQFRQLDIRPVLKSAVIENSLFAATDKANIPDEIAIQMVNILESEIDFHQDLRRDDHFNVIYEAYYDKGALIKLGDVLAVEFVNNGKTFQAIGYKDASQKMQYYTPDGNSLHKSFLRSPLEFSRITSGFSLGRFHPILQRMRAHKGVDMAAPIGTGIKASGDAVVDFVGEKSGYGKVIVLKHSNGISTVYGHLSRFNNDLHRGTKVSQGEIIGYVGMSGLATGPHLHYEFLLNGQHRDPMTVALPKSVPISAAEKPAFEAASNRLMAQIRLLDNTNFAALE
jgi:murein DD-endopeptidase MepM/ murein hydrolase activator NlpD